MDNKRKHSYDDASGLKESNYGVQRMLTFSLCTQRMDNIFIILESEALLFLTHAML